MNPSTWYVDNASLVPASPSLSGDQTANIAVVGGGLAGLNIALGLIERGAGQVTLLEARCPGFGASGRNGGFVFGGYSLDPRKLVQQAGAEQARRLYDWTRNAVDLIRRRARDWQIDCELAEGGVLWADWFRDRKNLLDFRDWLAHTLDVHWDFVPRRELAERVKSPVYGDGLLEPNAFHFHPLRYVHGLAARLQSRGAVLYENTPVIDIQRRGDGLRLITPAGNLRCKQAVIATGGYGPVLPVQRAIVPIATYVMVTQPLGARAREILDTPWAVYDTRFAFDYYRLLPDTRLLWGGRISTRNPDPGRLRRMLERDMLKVFPQLKGVGIDYCWSGWMSYARHQMPVLGQSAPGLWHAIGFGGHGMGPTTLAGEVLAEAITGNPERLHAFSSWPAVWAGGRVGRWAAQLTYWYKQMCDGIRSLRIT